MRPSRNCSGRATEARDRSVATLPPPRRFRSSFERASRHARRRATVPVPTPPTDERRPAVNLCTSHTIHRRAYCALAPRSVQSFRKPFRRVYMTYFFFYRFFLFYLLFSDIILLLLLLLLLSVFRRCTSTAAAAEFRYGVPESTTVTNNNNNIAIVRVRS